MEENDKQFENNEEQGEGAGSSNSPRARNKTVMLAPDVVGKTRAQIEEQMQQGFSGKAFGGTQQALPEQTAPNQPMYQEPPQHQPPPVEASPPPQHHAPQSPPPPGDGMQSMRLQPQDDLELGETIQGGGILRVGPPAVEEPIDTEPPASRAVPVQEPIQEQRSGGILGRQQHSGPEDSTLLPGQGPSRSDLFDPPGMDDGGHDSYHAGVNGVEHNDYVDIHEDDSGYVEAAPPPPPPPQRESPAIMAPPPPVSEQASIQQGSMGMEQHHVASAVAPAHQSGDRVVWKKEGPIVGFLVSYDKNKNGEVFRLQTGRLIVTSGDTGTGDYLFIEHDSVSPMHAILRIGKEGEMQVLDQLSENGTFIFRFDSEEEERLSGDKSVVEHGDILQFGDRIFYVCIVARDVDVVDDE